MAGLKFRDGITSGGFRPHFAWYIVGMATLLQLTTNFVSQAFAILMVVLQDSFGWTLTAITMAYFLRSIVGAVLSPLSGWIGDRYGARRAMLVGAGLYIAGMLLLSTINHVWQLYLYYSLILGVAQGLFRVNIPTTVAAWFKRRLGLAVGIQQSFGGMGASIMAPALALLLSRVDWQTGFLLIGSIGGVVVLVLLWRFYGDPVDRGLNPYGTAAADPPPHPALVNPEYTKLRGREFMRAARRTRAFWNLPAIHHLGCIGHAIVMVHAVFHAHTLGVSLEKASLIVSIYSLSSIASRFMTPILADRFGAKGVMAFFYFIQGVTVFMLFWAYDPWQFYLFAFMFGIGFGGEMSAFLVINRQYYGMGPVRTVFGYQSLGSGTGMAIGGLIGSVVFDAFGSYDIAWLVSIGASLVGVVLILFLEPTSRVLIPDWEEALPPEARSTPANREAPQPG